METKEKTVDDLKLFTTELLIKELMMRCEHGVIGIQTKGSSKEAGLYSAFSNGPVNETVEILSHLHSSIMKAHFG